MNPVRSALISGASSGLGAALAEELAATGVRLHLGGRDGARLDAVAALCRQRGAEVMTRQIDVTDPEATAAWVTDSDKTSPLDLVIANAGIIGETPPGEQSALARRIYEVNVLGTLNTIEPVLPAMRARGQGRICLIASVAGMIGLPRFSAYSGSKAALIIHGEAWASALRPQGISVTVACPGYIRTPMTEHNRFRMPFLMDAEPAAKKILAATLSGRARVTFPRPLVLGIRLLRLLPLEINVQ